MFIIKLYNDINLNVINKQSYLSPSNTLFHFVLTLLTNHFTNQHFNKVPRTGYKCILINTLIITAWHAINAIRNETLHGQSNSPSPKMAEEGFRDENFSYRKRPNC